MWALLLGQSFWREVAMREFLQAASNAAAGTVAAPVDLLAFILKKAGVPIQEPVGGSDWQKRVGLLRDVPQSAASLAGETVGLLSPVAAAAKAPQIARGLLQQAEDFRRYNNVLGPQASNAVQWTKPKTFDARTVEDGISADAAETLFRAHSGRDSPGVMHAWSSWTPQRSTAVAYTDNQGFGGSKIRKVAADTRNTLDVSSRRDGVDFERLAQAIGLPEPQEVAQQWLDRGWRYPWEESKAVKDALRASGFKFLKYEDDFPSGAETLVPLVDIALKKR